MTGWCPVHDKVYEADDGLCPRCGTALVADEDAPSYTVVVAPDGTTAEAEQNADQVRPAAPVSRRRVANAVSVVAAVVIAFVAGLAFPQSAKKDAERFTSPREAHADRTIGVIARSGGVALRLESFSQRGEFVVLRLTVPPVEGLDLGKLQDAGVSFFDASGGSIGGEELTVRTTPSGFILEGSVLTLRDKHVSAVGIDYLSLGASGEAESSLDLRGAWPASVETQPRARTAKGRLAPEEGPAYTITGLVGWVDHLEIGLGGPKEWPSWQYAAEFELVSGNDAARPATLEGGPATYAVRFYGVPKDWRRATLRLRVTGLSIPGPWSWKLGG